MAALVAPRGAVAACSSAVRTTGVPRARAALPRLPLPRSAPASRVCGSGPVGTSGSRGSVAANAASDFSAASLGNTAVLRNGFVDYYTLLQVDDDASQAEIKSAYRSLAKARLPYPIFLLMLDGTCIAAPTPLSAALMLPYRRATPTTWAAKATKFASCSTRLTRCCRIHRSEPPTTTSSSRRLLTQLTATQVGIGRSRAATSRRLRQLPPSTRSKMWAPGAGGPRS